MATSGITSSFLVLAGQDVLEASCPAGLHGADGYVRGGVSAIRPKLLQASPVHLELATIMVGVRYWPRSYGWCPLLATIMRPGEAGRYVIVARFELVS
jgi:hypothetical protein